LDILLPDIETDISSMLVGESLGGDWGENGEKKPKVFSPFIFLE
jgi:hypothetical protein